MFFRKIVARILYRLRKKLDERDDGEVPVWQIYSVLFFGALMVIMNQTAMKTALPTMITDLGVTPSIGQWAVSGYTLVKGVMVPITAFAMTKFRTRNLFILMMMIFGLGSLIAAMGINFYFVLGGSFLQGVGAGMVIPLMQTVILTITPAEKRGGALGLMGIVLGFGPTIGPALGGMVVDYLSWHFIFYFWAVGSLLMVPVALLVLTDVLPNSDPKIDWLTIFESLIGFGLLLFGLSIMGNSGIGSISAWIVVLVGLFFVYLFIKRNLDAEQPMLNVRLFKNKTFTICVVISTLSLMIITGISNVMPMYIQSVLGRTATISGLIVLPGGLIKAFLSPVSGKLYDKLGMSILGIAGGALIMFGSILYIFVGMETSNLILIMIYVIIAIGFGLSNVPVSTAAMNVLPDNMMGHGTSSKQTVRQIGGSFAITLVYSTMSIVSSIFTGPSNDLTNSGINIQGIRGGFGMVTILSIIVFVLSFFINEQKEKQSLKS